MTHLLERNLKTWKITDSTKLTTFLECNRKYFYEYVLGWRPSTPSNHLVFGSAWHKAMEYLLTHDYSTTSVMAAYQDFLKEYRKTFGPDTDTLFWPKTPENAELMLAIYAGKFKDDLLQYKVKFVEIGGRVNLTDEHVLYFKMDSVLERIRNGRIVSMDHKSGSNTWNWELQFPLGIQNGTYTHVLNCLYPQEIVDGVIFRGSFLKKSKKGWAQLGAGDPLSVQPPYDFVEYSAFKSLDQMQVWMWNTIYHIDQLQLEFEQLGDCSEDDEVLTAFPMNPTNCTKYFGCPYHDFCMAWANPLRRSEVPPPDFIEEHWDPTAIELTKTFDIGGEDGQGTSKLG